MGIRPNQEAREILDKIRYITVATVDTSGQPWNTPVAGFHFDDDYTLYWASWTDNQHSKNIRANGKAFIAVYDSTPSDGSPVTGVYIQAKVVELNTQEEAIEAALVFKDDLYNPSNGKQYLGSKPRRIYKATAQHIWTNGDSEVKGDLIDIRKDAERT